MKLFFVLILLSHSAYAEQEWRELLESEEFIVDEFDLEDEMDELLRPGETLDEKEAIKLDYLAGDELKELEEFEKLNEKKKIRGQKDIQEWDELSDAKDIELQQEKDYLELQNTVQIDDYRSKTRSAWDIQSIEFLENLEVEDYSFEDDLIPEGERTVLELEILDKAAKDTITQLPPQDKDTPEFKPEPFTAVIKPGSLIEDIETKKLKKIDRKLVVKAINNVIGGKVVYLFDKSGKKKYRTFLKNITDIDQFVNLKESPPLYYEYQPRAKNEGNDTNVQLIHSFSFSQEGIRGDYFQNLFDDQNTGGSVNQFDYQVFYKWPFSLKMGLSAGFQKGTWDGQSNSMQWYSGLYGLSLNQNFYSNWEAQLNASRYFLMKAEDDQGNSTRFQGNQFGFDLINIINTKWGPFFWSLTINQSYFSIKESSRNFTTSQQPESITTYGIKVGFRFEKDFWRYTF